MKKLHLNKVNPGNYTKDKVFYERLKSFNNAIIDISNTSLFLKTKDNKAFKSFLHKIEEDFMSETFKGSYEDGTSFRIVRPAGFAKSMMQMQGQAETITFAGMTGDGYAVHFSLADESAPDNQNFQQDRNTEFISAAESKAENLLIIADSQKDSNPQSAKEHLTRFMHLIDENKIEFLKFEHIQNIIYGYVLALRLGMISEETANYKLNQIKLQFESPDHLRFENNVHVSGPHGGAARGVEIKPNFEEEEGYIVTIYNQDGNHPLWGNNVQMAPKQMKIVHRTENEIQLRGFGFDSLGNPFDGYAITIHLEDNDINHIKLHMIDRGVVIKYLN